MTSAVQPDPPRSPADRALLLFPLLATLLIYGPAVAGAGWAFDDRGTVALPPPHGVLGLWTQADAYVWRPLTRTLQEGVVALAGRDAEPLRATNLALHLVNVALVEAVVLALAGRAGRASLSAARVAAGAGLAWAVDHALADSVCWSSDAGAVLSTTIALLLVLGALRLPTRAVPWIAGPMVLLAMLAKESAAPLALVVAGVVGGRAADDERPPLQGEPGTSRARRDAVATAVAGLLAVAGWVAWHDAISVDAASHVAVGLDAARAWLTMLPWLALPPWQAGVAHLWDPADLTGPVAGLAFLAGAAALVGVAAAGRRWLLIGYATWALMLVPVGIGVPVVGLLPLRYVYGGSALALPLLVGGAQRWAADAPPGCTRLGLAVLVGWLALHLPPLLTRVPAWAGDEALWPAEADREPDNAAVQWLWGSWQAERPDAPTRREGLKRMESTIGRLPRAFLSVEPATQRYTLAKVAFLAGEPRYALAQIDTWIAERQAAGRAVPANAWCLVADASERAGVPVPEAAERQCAGPGEGPAPR